MKEKEALNKWWFSYKENWPDDDYYDITHCWEKSEIICQFPWVNTVECKKCWQLLTQKILIWECFISNLIH